jgi:enterochelin esterase family protein
MTTYGALMKRFIAFHSLFLTWSIAILVSLPCFAATMLPVSPETHSDRTITFRLFMPFAHQVEVNIDGGISLPMTKSDDGVWSVKTQPLVPDIYGYSFIVDGATIADPMNTRYKSNMLTSASMVEISADTPQPWDQTPILHGEVHHHFYASAGANDQRDYYVYTPPDFHAGAAKRYPVLFLLHGFSDRANAWVEIGRANFILDTLIAHGKAKPMIVVMPLGYGVSDYAAHDSPNFGSARLTQQNFDIFQTILLTEVLPQIEKNYPILAGRKNRAIAGLSMGGSETLDTALNHRDQFAWVGSFSMGGLFNGVAKDDYPQIFPSLKDKAGSAPLLLWIACGTDDGFFPANQKFIAWLQTQGMNPIVVQTPGGHDWSVWRRNLLSFLPLLFQEAHAG